MKSVAKELFTKRFWMDVEERAFYSDEWIEEVGIMGVNSMEEAHVVLSRYRTVRVTVPELCDYLSKDYKLQFIDKNDPPIMFELLNTHMSNWIHVTNTLGYVAQIPPIEDFESMDALAEILFPYRKTSKALANILDLFRGPIARGQGGELTGGVYKPYSPLLFKYCQQVWG